LGIPIPLLAIEVIVMLPHSIALVLIEIEWVLSKSAALFFACELSASSFKTSTVFLSVEGYA